MPSERLRERAVELADLDEIPRQGEELHRIRTEMAMVCFEMIIKTDQLEALLASEDIEIKL